MEYKHQVQETDISFNTDQKKHQKQKHKNQYKPQIKRKCLQITYPTKDLNPGYIKNSPISVLKMDKWLEQLLHQRRYKNSKGSHEKMLNVIIHQEKQIKTR